LPCKAFCKAKTAFETLLLLLQNDDEQNVHQTGDDTKSMTNLIHLSNASILLVELAPRIDDEPLSLPPDFFLVVPIMIKIS
jgi:hypothetical protein